MKRSGFTMIELIFVIVILGILAAVAIPKLSATRDDAKVSKSLTEISGLVNEFSSYYTAHGKYDAASSAVTHVQLYDGKTNCDTETTTIATGNDYSYCTKDDGGDLENCVSFSPVNADGNLTVASLSGSGNVCKGIVASSSFSKNLVGTKSYGGTSVDY